MKKLAALAIALFALSIPSYAASNPSAPAPEGALAAQVTMHTIVLNWTNPNAQGTVNAYRAAGSCSASSVFVQIATGAPFAGPYTDASPLIGLQCYYVTPVVNGVEGGISNKISVASLVSPQPITGLAGTPN